nr:unnamed protein product [Digitaria exilis]
MAMFAVERNSKTRLLLDVSSGKIRGLSSSVFFPDATCAFENGGWLLMLQRKPPSGFFTERAAGAVFLLHPGTGRRLDLPPYDSSSDDELFVFHVDSHGTPLVATRVETLGFVPTVHVACPGDTYWSVYEHDTTDIAVVDPPPPRGESRATPRRRQRRLLDPASFVDVALLGTQAVFLDANGEVVVFDLAETAWRRRTPAVRPDSGFGQYARSLVAAGGEVLLVFFKLDMEALEWSPLERRELEDTSWFLRRGQSFRAKDTGRRRVYTFSGPEHCGGGGGSVAAEASVAAGSFSLGQGMSMKAITNVYACDLDDGSVEMVMPASIVTEAHHWVRPSVFATPAT